MNYIILTERDYEKDNSFKYRISKKEFKEFKKLMEDEQAEKGVVKSVEENREEYNKKYNIIEKEFIDTKKPTYHCEKCRAKLNDKTIKKLARRVLKKQVIKK